MPAVPLRPRKREVRLLVPAKVTAVVIELTIATILSKILTVHKKICSFYANLPAWSLLVHF